MLQQSCYYLIVSGLRNVSTQQNQPPDPKSLAVSYMPLLVLKPGQAGGGGGGGGGINILGKYILPMNYTV